MKVYQIYYQHASDGRQLVWASSKRRAGSILRERVEQLRELNENDDGKPCGIREVDIPTDRAGLIGWLNIHFTADNG